MKKVLVILTVIAVAGLAALALAYATTATTPDVSAVTMEQSSPCLAMSALPSGASDPIGMSADCAKVSCGDCPGPKCLIDGICCWDQSKNQPGLASCGCTADGKPTCHCDVGTPR